MVSIDFPTRDRSQSETDLLGRTIAVGFLIVMLFTTLAHGAVESWSLAFFGLMVVGLLLLWVSKSAIDRRLEMVFPSIAWPLLGLIVYGTLQSIPLTDDAGRRFAITLDVEATRLALVVVICMFVALIIAANSFVGTERLILLRNFLVIFGLLLAVFGLVQHFTWNGKYYWMFEPSTLEIAVFGPFINRNHFAGYLEMIIPIPVALILMRAVYGELSLFYGFSAVMMSIAVFISLSRGGMISLISGLLFVVGVGFKPAMDRLRERQESPARRWAFLLTRLAAMAAILITIGVGVWWTGSDEVLKRVQKSEFSVEARASKQGRETFFQSRGWIWRDTLTMIRANWVTGIGLGAYQTAYPLYSEEDGSIIVSQSHNDYLQIVADCGLVGGILALWFLAVAFRDFWRAINHRNQMKAGLALGCGGGMFALLVHSLFDFNLQLPSNALLFLVLAVVISQIGSAAANGKVSKTWLEQSSRVSATV